MGLSTEHLGSDAERRLVSAAGSWGRPVQSPISVQLCDHRWIVCSSELVSPSVKWAFRALSAVAVV